MAERDLEHDFLFAGASRVWTLTWGLAASGRPFVAGSRFPRWTVFYGIKDDALILYRVEGGETNLRRLIVG
jgi:hypothetical protein